MVKDTKDVYKTSSYRQQELLSDNRQDNEQASISDRLPSALELF